MEIQNLTILVEAVWCKRNEFICINLVDLFVTTKEVVIYVLKTFLFYENISGQQGFCIIFTVWSARFFLMYTTRNR